MPGKTACMEFEYIRHGTTSLIGFFDVATGRMESPYLNKTRTDEDFVEAVRKLVETDLQASWTFNDIASTVGEPVSSVFKCKRAVCESTKGVQQTGRR